MRRAKWDVAQLRSRAINSLVLAIELFNRPHEGGRSEAVLILLHHAFEMLLKAAIRGRTGTVHARDEKYTYDFHRCLDLAKDNLRLISDDEHATLSILDALRDTAVHFYQEISEDLLYLQAQAAVTLFDDLLKRAFGQKLADAVPSRVLPVSTRPPTDLALLIDSELSQLDQLLKSGSRRGPQAAARLRPILALATAVRREPARISEGELRRALTRRKRGEEWSVVLPEVAQLKLDTKGGGIPIEIRIQKNAELAVRVAREGEPVVGTLIKQEINIWDKFNMGRDDVAEKLGITGPKTSALMLELGIHEDRDCFQTLRRKATTFKGYSKKALDRLREAVESGVDVEEVWQKHRHRFGARKQS